ncbi:PqiC family protein [Salipiger mucosus]|uniref:ABC-type transport auxiliary lipoprotein component domain-containing protein n=1 Tax=Salipiger mucosus DSM 16094 TaxID=1123237 RepID=S9QZL7_9RHOB|nr:PqiC family protein [Salipiger mucosus]EPX85042.1 hypothetical protein Salmuc_00640 [Salipiger mucosus DSM 16094]
MYRFLPLALLLAACSGAEPRYLIEAPAEVRPAPLAVASLEVRDVSLPAYAEASEILVESADGGLEPAENALWADDPMRAVTLALADRIGRASNATVAAEPWPLEEDAQAAVEVRVTDMVARASGVFELTGQYAVSSYERVVRERIERFAIAVPLVDTTPGSIADATGRAVAQLAAEITEELSR